MDKMIQEIEQQIQRLQTIKQLLQQSQQFVLGHEFGGVAAGTTTLIPVKRGRGRPRKHPLPLPVAAPQVPAST